MLTRLPRRWALPWGRVLWQTVNMAAQHSCGEVAAAVAFDFVFAVFPGLLMLTSLLAVLGVSPDSLTIALSGIGVVVPGPVLQILEENAQHVWGSSHGLIVLGLVGVLWPASASMVTTMGALNRAYGVVEQRSFWRRRILSIALLMAFGLALVVIFNSLVFSRQVEGWLRLHWAFQQDFPSLSGMLRGAVVVLGTLGVVASVYRTVPAVRPRWVDVVPGSLVFLVLWLLVTSGFRYYVEHFGYYSLVYGVLGAVIVTLLSAYLMAFILLLGGELNAAIARARSAGGR
jgi:membrane protein